MPINRSTKCWENSAVVLGVNILSSVGLFSFLSNFLLQKLAWKK